MLDLPQHRTTSASRQTKRAYISGKSPEERDTFWKRRLVGILSPSGRLLIGNTYVIGKIRYGEIFCPICLKTRRVNLGNLVKFKVECLCLRNRKYLGVPQSVVDTLGERYDAKLQMCNPKNKDIYQNYAGRGIELRFMNREHFIRWVLECLPHQDYKGVDMDRIDNNGHYEPGNLRLVSRAVNLRNTRKNKWYDYMGVLVISADLWGAIKADYPGFDLSKSRTEKLAARGVPLPDILARKPRQKRSTHGFMTS
jgi:hypothetical protein